MLVKNVVIMCGGIYQYWKEPKAMSIVRGERLIERTIRLLKENGIDASIDSHHFCPTSQEEIDFYANAIKKGLYDKNVFCSVCK